ncbi:hypothetical protein AB0911_08010 [Streptomyces nigra]|uniref:hypothetical protein n=1 Tax=Streptomyces nigra TaxID=1827580 RepID=UPI0034567E71
MIAEAFDTFRTIALALAGWIIFGATVAATLLLAALATGAYGVRAVWRRTAGPSWQRGPIRARVYAARRTRRSTARTRPLWSHSQPLDYEEAA